MEKEFRKILGEESIMATPFGQLPQMSPIGMVPMAAPTMPPLLSMSQQKCEKFPMPQLPELGVAQMAAQAPMGPPAPMEPPMEPSMGIIVNQLYPPGPYALPQLPKLSGVAQMAAPMRAPMAPPMRAPMAPPMRAPMAPPMGAPMTPSCSEYYNAATYNYNLYTSTGNQIYLCYYHYYLAQYYWCLSGGQDLINLAYYYQQMAMYYKCIYNVYGRQDDLCNSYWHLSSYYQVAYLIYGAKTYKCKSYLYDSKYYYCRYQLTGDSTYYSYYQQSLSYYNSCISG